MTYNQIINKVLDQALIRLGLSNAARAAAPIEKSKEEVSKK